MSARWLVASRGVIWVYLRQCFCVEGGLGGGLVGAVEHGEVGLSGRTVRVH